MTSGTSVARVLAAFMTTVLVAGCGGADGGDQVRFMLTNDGCTHEGDMTPPATRIFYAAVENRSSRFGAFELFRIDARGTFAKLQAHIRETQLRLDGGPEPVRPPAFLTPMARTDVPDGESGVLVADLRPGQYAVVCVHVATVVGIFSAVDGAGIEPMRESEHPPTAVFLVRPLQELTPGDGPKPGPGPSIPLAATYAGKASPPASPTRCEFQVRSGASGAELTCGVRSA